MEEGDKDDCNNDKQKKENHLNKMRIQTIRLKEQSDEDVKKGEEER